MWLQTKFGFYSVVEHNEDVEIVLIRARAKKDLENLCELADDLRRDYRNAFVDGFEKKQIIETPAADYRWRLIVPRRAWMEVSLRLMTEINYPNFKTAVGKRDMRRADLYHNVWHVLYDIQTQDEIADADAAAWELSDEKALEDWMDAIGEKE